MMWPRKQIKFGASYNLFNGEEHLIPSLRMVRPVLDHINVVVQFTSNYGEPAPGSLRHLIDTIRHQGLVDDVIEFRPDLRKPAQENELGKRELGLQAALRRGVSYFLSMDADEYYETEAFSRAKGVIMASGLETTGAHSYLHIKRPIWRSKEPDTTCVCFLTKIGRGSRLDYGGDFPALVDPTRRLHGDHRFHMFPPDEISMFHMNLVRKDDLASKLRNTSSAHMTAFIEQVRQTYANWRFGMPLAFPNKPPMEIIEVGDLFGIDALFQ